MRNVPKKATSMGLHDPRGVLCWYGNRREELFLSTEAAALKLFSVPAEAGRPVLHQQLALLLHWRSSEGFCTLSTQRGGTQRMCVAAHTLDMHSARVYASASHKEGKSFLTCIHVPPSLRPHTRKSDLDTETGGK